MTDFEKLIANFRKAIANYKQRKRYPEFDSVKVNEADLTDEQFLLIFDIAEDLKH